MRQVLVDGLRDWKERNKEILKALRIDHKMTKLPESLKKKIMAEIKKKNDMNEQIDIEIKRQEKNIKNNFVKDDRL